MEVIKGATFLFLTLLGYAFSGWTLSEMWKWFIIPVFPLMPVLTTAKAIGVVLVVNLLTQRYSAHELENIEAMVKAKLLNDFVFPLVILFISWVFHDFIF